MRRFLAIATMLVLLGGAGGWAGAASITAADFSASATLINFDNLTGGTTVFTGDIITSQYAAVGVTFVNPTRVTRANASPLGSEAVAASKPNVAFITQGSGGAPVAPQELHFSVPVNLVGMDVFLTQGANVTLAVYDSGHALLETLTLTGTYQGSGDLDYTFIGLRESTNIAEATITSNGGSFNFSIDNLRFESTAVPSVPEPSTLVLAGIGGLALLGYARRRALAA
jgi:hypothetical protein